MKDACTKVDAYFFILCVRFVFVFVMFCYDFSLFWSFCNIWPICGFSIKCRPKKQVNFRTYLFQHNNTKLWVLLALNYEYCFFWYCIKNLTKIFSYAGYWTDSNITKKNYNYTLRIYNKKISKAKYTYTKYWDSN